MRIRDGATGVRATQVAATALPPAYVGWRGRGYSSRGYRSTARLRGLEPEMRQFAVAGMRSACTSYQQACMQFPTPARAGGR